MEAFFFQAFELILPVLFIQQQVVANAPDVFLNIRQSDDRRGIFQPDGFIAIIDIRGKDAVPGSKHALNTAGAGCTGHAENGKGCFDSLVHSIAFPHKSNRIQERIEDFKFDQQ